MESWICITDDGEISQFNRFDTEEDAIAYGEDYINSHQVGNYEIYEDCHSPYMGILDEEETATEETETTETTEEISQESHEVKTSPKTGDNGETGLILETVTVGIILLILICRKVLKGE